MADKRYDKPNTSCNGLQKPTIGDRTGRIIYKIGHGYYPGGFFEEYAPALTISSWEYNNFIIEIEG